MLRRAPRIAFVSAATAVLIVALVGPMSLGMTARVRAQRGFTAAERTAIAGGELVERPSPDERGGHFLGGASYRVVDRPIDEVWRALHDAGSYRFMLPNTSESTVVQTHDDGVVLRVGHHYGVVGATYHLRLRYDDTADHVDFSLDTTRANDIAAARGFCELSRYEDDRTLITWAARVDPGDSIFLDPLRSEIQRWVLRVPSTMRTYLVDGSGRDRYRSE